jgi:hypothetical protein
VRRTLPRIVSPDHHVWLDWQNAVSWHDRFVGGLGWLGVFDEALLPWSAQIVGRGA